MSKIYKGSLLATTVMAGLTFVTPAHAQTATTTDQPATTAAPAAQEPPVSPVADADEGEGTQSIVVTGSRIQRRDLTSSSQFLTTTNDPRVVRIESLTTFVARNRPSFPTS